MRASIAKDPERFAPACFWLLSLLLAKHYQVSQLVMRLGKNLVVANGFLLSAASGSLYYVIVEISTALQIGMD